MNWLKKTSQTWGLDDLPRMVRMAFDLHPLAEKHRAGKFEPHNPLSIPDNHNLYFHNHEYAVRVHLHTPDQQNPAQRHQNQLYVNISVSDGKRRIVDDWISMNYDIGDVRQAPNIIVETTYRLIDQAEGFGDAGGGPDMDPDPSPGPFGYIDSPTGSPVLVPAFSGKRIKHGSHIKVAKYMNDSCTICEHCNSNLRAESMVENPKHIYNPGQLYVCACGKSRIWTNSVRDLDSLLLFFDGKPNKYGERRYTRGFCNDKYCGYTFDFIFPLKNGIDVPGVSQRLDRIGNPDVSDNQNIAINFRAEDSDGQTGQILEWYRSRLEELRKFAQTG